MEFEIIPIIRQTFMVSGYVLFMMLIIEYVNVRSQGHWSMPLKKSKWLQLITAVLLGLTPGCVGTFAVVSLFTHNIVNFSALLAATIATFGDETFVFLSMDPKGAIFTMGILGGIALLTGTITNLLIKKDPQHLRKNVHFETHKEDCCTAHQHLNEIKIQLQKISFSRSLLIGIIILIAFSQFAGLAFHEEHAHEAMAGHEHGILSTETIIFMLAAGLSLIIILTVPEHFLTEHLWGHVIKKHFVRIFLWTLGSLLFINLLLQFVDLSTWIQSNTFILIALALAVGLIPFSGPHIFFLSLFISGTIPFSILLANFTVQEGHGALPLLAESKKGFLFIKSIKVLIGLLIGISGYYFGF